MRRRLGEWPTYINIGQLDKGHVVKPACRLPTRTFEKERIEKPEACAGDLFDVKFEHIAGEAAHPRNEKLGLIFVTEKQNIITKPKIRPDFASLSDPI